MAQTPFLLGVLILAPLWILDLHMLHLLGHGWPGHVPSQCDVLRVWSEREIQGVGISSGHSTASPWSHEMLYLAANGKKDFSPRV